MAADYIFKYYILKNTIPPNQAVVFLLILKITIMHKNNLSKKVE